MHIHICPQEIAAAIMVWENIKVYTYHYKHILFSLFARMRDKNCEVCNEQEHS